MKDYIFGIEAEVYNGASEGGFIVNRGVDGNQTDNNPYHKQYLSNPANRSTTQQAGRITSIPSPYARMHLTDLAFEESNCGIGILTQQQRQQQQLAPDYKKALSHCLDIFELMYHADEFNLSQMGITLHKLDLLSTDTINNAEINILQDGQGNPTQLGKYIKTLDLFRAAYLKTIDKRRQGSTTPYYFDFKSLYILKYKGKTFAATSPFTGFFTKADCDLTDANIVINNRKLLSSDPATWADCNARNPQFIEFMYLLLKDYNLDKTFDNLFKALEDVVNQDSTWKVSIGQKTFQQNRDYHKFNMAVSGLQQVPDSQVYIRPDGLDCSYLKFLLYLQKPVDLTISSEEYNTPLAERKFNGSFLQWIGVNDILAESLFVLPYDVNENYTVIPYKDATRGDKEYRRCLVPVKSEALKYFSLDTLVNNLTIVRTESDSYSVELKVSLNDGISVVLRREYHMNPENAKFPNGKLIQGSDMKPFAFGVYPFVKSDNALNIYKVLFYNVFNSDYKLDFYRSGNQLLLQNAEHSFNKTNDVNDDYVTLNCEYHHLEHQDGFEYAELTVDKKYTSLIVPRLRKIPVQPNKINVAIDLGTSNTYVAYSVDNPMNQTALDIREIKTSHVTPNQVNWNELTFMNGRCEAIVRPAGVDECNSDDLVVRLNDDNTQKATSEMLDHQLCEFIPSRIDNNGGSNYSFPIPSVLNFLRVNSKRLDLNELPQSNPLINTAIPFAYYERGMRQRVGAPINYYYDLISKGTTFKWYRTRDKNGNYNLDKGGEAAFKAFIRELLFIVRCHILSEGFQLSNVNVYWSYPLSFDPALLNDYINEWQNAFCEIIDRNGVGRVHYTCESRSPIYHCINPLTIRNLTLLVDIGGGSTDVIGYKNFQPLFVSSSKFAGNALYLSGDLNNARIRTGGYQDTLMYKYVQKIAALDGNATQDSNGVATQTIGLNEEMATIMNYGFIKYPNEFKQIFNNLPAEFMLKLHNSALLYHVAQLSHAQSPEEAPCEIYLTGNGSKQLQMNSDCNQMIKNVFNHVYSNLSEPHQGIDVRFPNEPKVATAVGTLKGIKDGIALDAAAISGSCIAWGDGDNVLQNSMHGAQLTTKCTIENVFANVRDFVEMFYSKIYITPMPSVTKDEMLDVIKNCESTTPHETPSLIDDSFFLRIISEVMEKLSVALANRIR